MLNFFPPPRHNHMYYTFSHGPETQTSLKQKKICDVTSLVLVVLFILHTDVDYLKDVVVGAELQCSDIDLDIVFQKVLCQLADLFRPGSAPHQCLSVGLPKEHTEK